MDTHIQKSDAIPGSSPNSPVLLGTSIRIVLPGGKNQEDRQSYYAEVTLLYIVRGDEAWEWVKAQGVFDVPSEAGFDYVLAQVKFGYFQRPRGTKVDPYTLVEGQFVAVSSDGKTEYKIPHVSQQPKPELIGYTFKASEYREGRILLQVPKDEKKPLLIFKREQTGGGSLWMWGPLWFQT